MFSRSSRTPLAFLAVALLVVVGLLGGTSSPARASGSLNWAQYHGAADRTGFNDSESSLGPANVADLAIAWSTPLSPATPVTAPVVSDGKVFAGSNDGRLYALDEASGALLWSATTGASIVHSPAVDAGRVFVGSDDGKFYAYPISCTTPCAPLWTRQLAGGMSAPPAVADGVVYVGASRGTDGDLWAFDAATGAIIWRAQPNERPTTPAVANGMVYVTAGALFAYPTACGNPCTYAWAGQGAGSQPVVSGGFVYVDAGFVNHFEVFAASPSCTTPCPLAWDAFTMSHAHTAPAVGGGKVYLAEGSGVVQAFPATCASSSCSALWTATITSPGGWYEKSSPLPSPALANGVLYLGANDGNLYALDAATGSTLAAKNVGSVLSAPAVVNGTVYVGSFAGIVHALRAPVTDSSAPVIDVTVSPSPNALGWNNTTVNVSWSVTDPESGIASTTGCDTVSVTAETSGATLTCSARNGVGLTNTRSVTIRIDRTGPSITFAGNAGTYTVDQSVAISCTATDGLSGLASAACPTFTGPAYVAGLGSHTLTASAIDNAGNSSTASATFTVTVTYASLCNLSQSFTSESRIGNALCALLRVASASDANGNPQLKAAALLAFTRLVTAQSGKDITPSDASILIDLAKHL